MPARGAGRDWSIRRPEIHGDPSPQGTQKLTHGSADIPNRGTHFGHPPRPGAPFGNHNNKNGNLPVEWFEGFGWTTSAKVAEWFDKEFIRYKAENKLKFKAFKSFHPVGTYEFKYPSYSLFDNEGILD